MPATQRKNVYHSRNREVNKEPWPFGIDDEDFEVFPWLINDMAQWELNAITVRDERGEATGQEDLKPFWNFWRTAFGCSLTTASDEERAKAEEEFGRFQRTLRSPDHDIEAATLVQMIQDIVAASAGRPTQRSKS